jgi:hypothetical protein
MDFQQSSNLTTTTGYLNIAPASSLILDATNGTIDFRIGSSERAKIDTSGRLLVGTSSAPTGGRGQYALQVIQGYAGASTNAGWLSIQRGQAASAMTSGNSVGLISFCDNTGGAFAEITCNADATPGTNDYPGQLVFSTTADGASSPTERMRIKSTGYTTTFATTDGFRVSSAAAAGTASDLFDGAHSATAIDTGTISFRVTTNGNTTNTNNSYGAISDAKLKENIVDASSQWSDIKALQVRKYNLKAETGQQTHTQIGLVAQEAELVSPGLVYETPDRDAEGNDLGTVTKGVNYSVLYMKAVKALQEAMERIETLEARLTAAGID